MIVCIEVEAVVVISCTEESDEDLNIVVVIDSIVEVVLPSVT